MFSLAFCKVPSAGMQNLVFAPPQRGSTLPRRRLLGNFAKVQFSFIVPAGA